MLEIIETPQEANLLFEEFAGKDLEVLKRIEKQFNISSESVWYAFFEATKSGRVDIMKWLYKTYKIPKNRIMLTRAGNIAYKNNQREALLWLHKTFCT